MYKTKQESKICGLIFSYGNTKLEERYDVNNSFIKTKPYAAWHNMIYRCYNNKNRHKSYRGIKVLGAKFRNFLLFLQWYKNSGYEFYKLRNIKCTVDKDFLSLFQPNSLYTYSENTALLIPLYLNLKLPRKNFNNIKTIKINNVKIDHVNNNIELIYKYITLKAILYCVINDLLSQNALSRILRSKTYLIIQSYDLDLLTIIKIDGVFKQ